MYHIIVALTLGEGGGCTDFLHNLNYSNCSRKNYPTMVIPFDVSYMEEGKVLFQNSPYIEKKKFRNLYDVHARDRKKILHSKNHKLVK